MPSAGVRRRAFMALCALVGVTGGRSSFAEEAATEHVIVAHPSAGEASLTLDAARRILGAQQEYWANDTPILIVVPPKGSTSLAWMLDQILRMPEGAYRRHLMNQVFRGAARQPVSAGSIEEVVREVSGRRGAVSVLPRSLVTPGTRVVPLPLKG
jgi:hypothetical protein